MGHIIKEVYLYVVIDEYGNEGVAGFLDKSTGTWIPLVGSDRARLDSLRKIADGVGTLTGLKGTWLKFTTREEL